MYISVRTTGDTYTLINLDHVAAITFEGDDKIRFHDAHEDTYWEVHMTKSSLIKTLRHMELLP